MMLLTPMIMIPIFGSMLWGGRANIPELVRPLIALGGMAVTLFGVIQLMGNQFGFDRDGFRVFVLSPASRRDILLGKNLVFVPLVLGFGLFMLGLVQVFCPLGVDHFVGTVPLFLAMFLLFCMFANIMSIYTPMHIAPGAPQTLKPEAGHRAAANAHVSDRVPINPVADSITVRNRVDHAVYGLDDASSDLFHLFAS